MEYNTTKLTSFVPELSRSGIDLKCLLKRLAVNYQEAVDSKQSEATGDTQLQAEYLIGETEQLVTAMYSILPDADLRSLSDEFACLMQLFSNQKERPRSPYLH